MSVPAWPMPIHQTKLTISNPQPTGIMMPNRPTPMVITAAMQKKRPRTKINESPKPTYQNHGVRPVRTMELILSVIEPKVCPGSMIGRESPASAG